MRPRHRPLAWMLPTAAGVLMIGALTALEVTAWQGFDDAHSTLSRATQSQHAAVTHARTALGLSRETTTTADLMLAVQDAGLMSATDRTSIANTNATAQQHQQATDVLLPATPTTAPTRPFWFWEANEFAQHLRLQASDARRNARALTAAEDSLAASTTALRTQAGAALTSAADRAAAAEADNIPATNDSVLAVRGAAARVRSLAAPLQENAAAAYSDLSLAIRQLQRSHAATLAAESGPLQQSRLELEAFARSLAPGILLDFAWADMINGKGESNGYLSGETAWWYDRGGYATIRLSNSIAEDWPSDAARAIVAHEVGHAITIRCRTMYDTSNDQTAEAWATAWALSMGFTNDANGTSAYGAPPDSLVQTASGCR